MKAQAVYEIDFSGEGCTTLAFTLIQPAEEGWIPKRLEEMRMKGSITVK